MTVRKFSLCAALALSAACSRESAAPSPEQDRELNSAAEMLNKAPDALENVDGDALIAGREPEANAGER